MKGIIISFIIWFILWLSVIAIYKVQIKVYTFNSACQQMWYDYYNPYIMSHWVCIIEMKDWTRRKFELFESEKITEWPYKWFYK